MLYSYKTMLIIHKYLIFLIIIFAIIDSIVLLKIKKQSLDVKGQYAKLQCKYRFQAVTVVKAVLILLLSYFLLNPPGNAGALGAIAILYCLIVVIFLKDFFKAKRHTEKA